jgi:hypothetical protein
MQVVYGCNLGQLLIADTVNFLGNYSTWLSPFGPTDVSRASEKATQLEGTKLMERQAKKFARAVLLCALAALAGGCRKRPRSLLPTAPPSTPALPTPTSTPTTAAPTPAMPTPT